MVKLNVWLMHMFSFVWMQILMNVKIQEFVVQASATTPSEITPASALPTTCPSMEGTTAWVSLNTSLTDCTERQNITVMQKQLSDCNLYAYAQTWGRATATETFTWTMGHAMGSWPLTWPKKCAAAPTTSVVHGTNRANSVLFPAPVRSHTCGA